MRRLDSVTDEFEQSLGEGGEQWSLVCCSPWGRKESDTTEQHNISVKISKSLNHHFIWGQVLIGEWSFRLSSQDLLVLCDNFSNLANAFFYVE